PARFPYTTRFRSDQPRHGELPADLRVVVDGRAGRRVAGVQHVELHVLGGGDALDGLHRERVLVLAVRADAEFDAAERGPAVLPRRRLRVTCPADVGQYINGDDPGDGVAVLGALDVHPIAYVPV